MTVSEFLTKYNGKGIDFDGYYGFQCMDLYRQYVKEVVGTPQSVAVPGAKDVWNNYRKEDFIRIANSPDNVPLKGDIVIWGTGVGQFGHIAVFYQGNVWNFTSFDQNWPVNSTCHFQPHNYNYVLGWLRPKNATTPTPVPPSPISDSQFRQKTKDIILSGDSDSTKVSKIKALV